LEIKVLAKRIPKNYAVKTKKGGLLSNKESF